MTDTEEQLAPSVAELLAALEIDDTPVDLNAVLTVLIDAVTLHEGVTRLLRENATKHGLRLRHLLRADDAARGDAVLHDERLPHRLLQAGGERPAHDVGRRAGRKR